MEGEFLVPFEISSEPTETLPCFGSENATVGEWHVAQDWFLYFDRLMSKNRSWPSPSRLMSSFAGAWQHATRKSVMNAF